MVLFEYQNRIVETKTFANISETDGNTYREMLFRIVKVILYNVLLNRKFIRTE